MGSNPQSLLLRNVRAVLPERLVDATNVFIEQGTIARITEGAAQYRGTDCATIDLDGVTLFPGFIDVHIHGAVGVDTMAADQPDLERVSRFLASKGVTGWLPTLVPATTADYRGAIQAIAGAMSSATGARILGVHYEGPFVNSHQCGALRSQFFRSFSTATELDDLPVLRQAARHMITVAPEIDGGLELVRELHARGWIVSIGHTRASFELLEEAYAAGARHMTHFMNAMAPLHHRSAGPVGWGLLRDDVTCDLIADGIHLDREMLRLLLKSKGADRLSLISDAVAAAGMGDGDYEIWGETITVKDGRTANERGAIAGSVITMLDAVRMMLSLGATETDVAMMAAGNPAKLLGIDDERGSIAAGKRADLVALDAKGNVALTIVGGEIVFDPVKRME
ncbi:MAG TPA: N-acetylglucosamine-6-phosphate deacetylase [Pyrinomonadaceae bacterium]|nr:N-acetylglucosamine-6-phosphate deacetylase [Pyrinomonadaceae bacterium]